MNSRETLQIAKISDNWLPINVHKSKMENNSNKCPICGIEDETIQHMIKCTSSYDHRII